MKRTVILVNKDFEYKGFIEGLRDTVDVFAGTNGRDAECRFDNLLADVYCIQHLFVDSENSSNSEVKYGYLKQLFRSNEFRLDDVDSILSFSTSESTRDVQSAEEAICIDANCSMNGCVFVGNRFFLSDQSMNDGETKSHLVIGSNESEHTEWYVSETVCRKMYGTLNRMRMKFKHAPFNPSVNPRCIAGDNLACVGVVNVMNYSCYGKADESAYEKFVNKSIGNFGVPVGIETTHGVVVKALENVCSEIPMMNSIPVTFISPIVDRYLKFDEDVDGTSGKQNFVCSYNGGVATGHILKIMDNN